MRRTLRGSVGRLALVLASGLAVMPRSPAAAAGRLSVAVASQTNLGIPGDGDRALAVKGYLLTDLTPEARLHVVAPQRTDSLCGQFATSAWDIDGDFLFRRLSAVRQLDALVYVTEDEPGDDRLTVWVLRAGRPARRDVTLPGPDLAGSFRAAADFVRAELGLPRAAPGPAAFADDPVLFTTHQRALGSPPYLELTTAGFGREPAPPPAATGLATILWEADKKSVPLAARLLRCCVAAPAEDPGNRQQAQLEQALLAVLGTPLESAAYPLLAGPRGRAFEAGLQRLILPLLPDRKASPIPEEPLITEDAFLEPAGDPDSPLGDLEAAAPPAAGKKAAPPPSRAAMLAAVRGLGFIATPSAARALVGAADSSDAARATLRTLAADAARPVALAATLGLFHQGTTMPHLLPALRALPDSAFVTAPLACAAYGALAEAADKDRVNSLALAVRGSGRAALVGARLRLDAVGRGAITRPTAAVSAAARRWRP